MKTKDLHQFMYATSYKLAQDAFNMQCISPETPLAVWFSKAGPDDKFSDFAVCPEPPGKEWTRGIALSAAWNRHESANKILGAMFVWPIVGGAA